MTLKKNSLICLMFCVVGLITLPQTVTAQGLIWNLPEDGTEIRFEGTYTQTNYRQDSGEANKPLEWTRHVFIRSVGKEMAEFKGNTVPCRWIEIKVVTGLDTEAGLDTGPVGVRIYKVLIPENRVIGTLKGTRSEDKDTILISFIPVVKGWIQSGGSIQQDDGSIRSLATTKPIQGGILQLHPLLSQLMHYREMTLSDTEEDPNVPAGAVMAKKLTAKQTFESRSHRTVNDAVLYRSEDASKAPFGLAAWKVTVTIEEKDPTYPKSEFRLKSRIEEELKAVEIKTDAESELIPPQN